MMVVLIFFLMMIIISLSTDPYPTCGNCYCATGNNGNDACPIDKPQTVYTSDVIDIYRSQIPLTIYTLRCNPYNDITCETIPIQTYTNISTSVCGIIYNDNNCTSYNMITYETEEIAKLSNAYITHTGSCGLCSTTQDLSVYLSKDFTKAGKKCATIGLLNSDEGIKCYESIGLTYECAKIWNYDGIYDATKCGKVCTDYLFADNNGPPPQCLLNPCLQCDEDYAGPNFTKFAGRTRRRSGLISEIIRNCSSISNISHNPYQYCNL